MKAKYYKPKKSEVKVKEEYHPERRGRKATRKWGNGRPLGIKTKWEKTILYEKEEAANKRAHREGFVWDKADELV